MTDVDPGHDLADMLKLVDKVFGIDRVLNDRGTEIIPEYYDHSGPAYERMHSTQGCMHGALNPDGVFSFEGYLVQPQAIIAEAQGLQATRVLELGCGKGFNSLFIAQHLHDISITGTDLLPAHVEKARDFARAAGQTNVSYQQASYEPLPERFRDFDIVFGFETLCYAHDLDVVARAVAAALRPGGRFVMYDMHTFGSLDDLNPEVALATRLYEVSVAVTHGFIQAGHWEAALRGAGLLVDEPQDFTQDLLPGLYRQVEMSYRVLSDWKKRVAIKVMNPLMTRNAIAGLLGPHICRLGKPANDGALGYQKITATMPL